MAKRKRLGPAVLAAPAASTGAEQADNRTGTRRPPIADVSGDAAAQAAFEEVSAELRSAREEGRMVLSLPLAAVEAAHLVRDRVAMDAEDLMVLKDSLRSRGQQTPVEVLELGGGRYGLISGWRRVTALQDLLEETGDSRFAAVKAFLRRPEDVSDAYLAMVEENEIRADLSFYERARIAVEAAQAGVFPDTQTAVQRLFAAARAPKRSKIMAFTHLVTHLDAALRFPAAIPEKVGLALSAALQEDSRFQSRLEAALHAAGPADAAAERHVLDAALRLRRAKPGDRAAVEKLPGGLTLKAEPGRITLSGKPVDDHLLAALRDWLARR